MQISKFVKNLFHCYTFAWRLKAGKITFPRLYAFISVLSYMAFKSLESKNLLNPFHRIIRNLQINSFEVILKLRRLACPCDHAADLRVFQNPCQYLDVIQSLERKGIQVKVSDLSDAMELPRPGVTRTVKEMEEKGYLQKIASEEDGRVTYITVTKKGSELSQKYDEQYFDSLLPYMEEIPDEDAECMIQTIEKFYQIMCERRKHYDER